ncbi:hypothetical protein GCM10018793_38420 [Streptomyces sulfonofaciens]|uniref:Uncharacterized protein n=1 Tax=Streptomyces sulfonofaciens TaxID=68272 RepID=A0A919GCB1_9ACTN|nr:hypothetical protein GCM10018793_38420 [Streptomyces sulfonofaciens]
MCTRSAEAVVPVVGAAVAGERLRAADVSTASTRAQDSGTREGTADPTRTASTRA